jgi:hypothetical protein
MPDHQPIDDFLWSNQLFANSLDLTISHVGAFLWRTSTFSDF